MEQTMRKIIIVFLILLTAEAKADVHGVLPDDVATIEALIDAHKKMKSAEDLAVLELTAIKTEQSLSQKAMSAYNQTRTILNKRLSDTNSYLMLALQITNVAAKCKNLVENYAEFTSIVYEYAKDKPFAMLYYTRANYVLQKEVRRMSQLIAGYTAAGLGLLKATLEEKHHMLSMIDAQIAKMNRVICHNSVICRGMVNTGVKKYHILDMFQSKEYKDMTNDIIGLWLKQSSKS